MNIFQGNFEEDIMLILFAEGAISAKSLVEKVRAKRGQISKQGVYRVLRKLKYEEKVVRYKSTISLNNLWLQKLKLLLEDTSDRSSLLGNLGHLNQGEKISLKIKGLVGMDQVWSHVFQSIEESVVSSHPLYLFNLHNWSIIIREEIDKLHIQVLQKKQRPIFLTIGGKTTLDRETVLLARLENINCTIDSRISKPAYIAVIGDYIIQIKLLQQSEFLINRVFCCL